MLKFSRNHENEADTQGVKYMTAAGYDPQGMIQVLEVLTNLGKGGRTPEFLSTHPYPESRMGNIKRLIRDRYEFTRGNPQYRKYPSRFLNGAAPYLQK